MDAKQAIKKLCEYTHQPGVYLGTNSVAGIVQLIKRQDEQNKKTRWIPVGEGLPKGLYPAVDIFLKNGCDRIINVRYHKNGFDTDIYGGRIDVSNVTHWRYSNSDRPEGL